MHLVFDQYILSFYIKPRAKESDTTGIGEVAVPRVLCAVLNTGHRNVRVGVQRIYVTAFRLENGSREIIPKIHTLAKSLVLYLHFIF